jgi:AhpD family alkylhydroperoxidase
MPEPELLTSKRAELIAIGASIAAGCRPCTAYHFREATAAGAGQDEIRQAVNVALEARRSAAAGMAQLADRLLEGTLNRPVVSEAGYLDELIAAAAALAVNCGMDLTEHIARARDLGASGSQVETALDIGRAVKKMAAKRVEAAAGRALPESKRFAADDDRLAGIRGEQRQLEPWAASGGDLQRPGGSPLPECGGPGGILR